MTNINNKLAEEIGFLVAQKLGLEPSQITEWTATSDEPGVVTVTWEGSALLTTTEFAQIMNNARAKVGSR